MHSESVILIPTHTKSGPQGSRSEQGYPLHTSGVTKEPPGHWTSHSTQVFVHGSRRVKESPVTSQASPILGLSHPTKMAVNTTARPIRRNTEHLMWSPNLFIVWRYRLWDMHALPKVLNRLGARRRRTRLRLWVWCMGFAHIPPVVAVDLVL